MVLSYTHAFNRLTNPYSTSKLDVQYGHLLALILISDIQCFGLYFSYVLYRLDYGRLGGGGYET